MNKCESCYWWNQYYDRCIKKNNNEECEYEECCHVCQGVACYKYKGKIYCEDCMEEGIEGLETWVEKHYVVNGEYICSDNCSDDPLLNIDGVESI